MEQLEGTESLGQVIVGELVAGRYQVESLVARGAMGAVYRAIQQPLGRRVALKVLDVRWGDVEGVDYAKTFLEEAATLARLEHANTVRVYDYGEWEGRHFLVMEYVEGFSLGRYLAAGPMPASRLLPIMIQICGALQEAHGNGMIHRDLKPGNVLITRHAGSLDVVKLVDFGLVASFWDGTSGRSRQLMGTPQYMAPEQIRDEACGPRTDIYALGVLMYRALTGEGPFARDSVQKVLQAQLHEEPWPFRDVNLELDVPPSLEWVVFRCLRKDPKERFSSVGELIRALRVCQLAVDEPWAKSLELGIDEGSTVLPKDITETSQSSVRLNRAFVERIVRESDTQKPGYGAVTLMLMVFVVFAVGIALGLLLGGDIALPMTG